MAESDVGWWREQMRPPEGWRQLAEASDAAAEMELLRALEWDPIKDLFVTDDPATAYLKEKKLLGKRCVFFFEGSQLIGFLPIGDGGEDR